MIRVSVCSVNTAFYPGKSIRMLLTEILVALSSLQDRCPYGWCLDSRSLAAMVICRYRLVVDCRFRIPALFDLQYAVQPKSTQSSDKSHDRYRVASTSKDRLHRIGLQEMICWESLSFWKDATSTAFPSALYGKRLEGLSFQGTFARLI
jgi:hypothetical protein